MNMLSAKPRKTLRWVGFCRKKTNVCVKIDCNLFLCDQWIKHHAGEKPSQPIIKINNNIV
ncbi:hypothetical protein BMR11_17750 [Methylococcaceae bacterium CS5]|nr:hypothetical protein BMR11_17750 [Methylococcaceae bacterium CS5]